MLLYIVRRLAALAATFATVTALSFVLFYARGGQAIVRPLLPRDATAAAVDQKLHQLGLDEPLINQYFNWVIALLRGDLGNSYKSGQPVVDIMATRIPVTLSLIVASLVITILFSLVLGVWAATRGGFVDRVVQGLSVLLGAVPSYWLALALVIVFSLGLGLFPATGFIPLQQSPAGWLLTVTLPSIAISLGAVFGLAVWIRSSVIDIQRQDWVRTLRSRGLSENAIMFRHVLRNAAAPTVQIVGLMVIGLIGGTIIVERIFALPGVGALALNSGRDGDVPVVLGTVTFMVLVVVAINLIVDLTTGLLNPKARER